MKVKNELTIFQNEFVQYLDKTKKRMHEMITFKPIDPHRAEKRNTALS